MLQQRGAQRQQDEHGPGHAGRLRRRATQRNAPFGLASIDQPPRSTARRRAMTDVIPMIAYQDGIAALQWLAGAFGFQERTRMVGDDGRLAHGEMQAGDGIIMLATPTPDYLAPRIHRERCADARRWLSVPWVVDGVLVMVDDVDSHHRRAVEHGAHVLSPPEDGFPARRYRVEDLEGHRWMFMQRAAR
jgi:PhnB protein